MREKYVLSLLMVAGLFIISSCTTTKLMTSDVRPSDIKDLAYFEPFSYISLVSKGNRSSYDSALSLRSERSIEKVVKEWKGLVPLDEEMIIPDISIKGKLERETGFLFQSAYGRKNFASVKLTPIVDSLLKASGKRFGLITVGAGFTRTRGNFGGQIAKGLALSILTLGTYYQSPVKASSSVFVMIVDSRENNIAFYRKSLAQDKEPLDENVLRKQFKKIFKGYYWQ